MDFIDDDGGLSFEFFLPRNQIVRSVNVVNVDSLRGEYISKEERICKDGKIYARNARARARSHEAKKDESQVLRLVLGAQK